ncbi:MAG: phosphoglycerate kinase [Nanohaloarchaea archaeon SW_4_43_9]|nr:MAG: phosphoglycerate kinase [Nanohaloarchaea archaeon SW_4_43_9]
MKSIQEIDVEEKRVLLRTDLNLPIENGEPQKTVRFERYLETIKELSEKGAKTVIMAHQGRPARNDFLSLRPHAEMLSDSMDEEVEFIPSFFGPELGEKVARMKKGEVAILQNIRFLSEELQNASPEEHAQDFFVQKASDYFDLYVDDAFSAAHRSHGSMVGFTETLDSYPGLIMQRELENCSRIRENFDSGVLVLGGEKPSDLISIMRELGDNVHKIMLGGIAGELALRIEGYELGKKEEWIEKHGFDSREDELAEVIVEYEDKIMIPEDVATDEDNRSVGNIKGEMIWDIGQKTTEKYVSEIKKADAVVMKGPMGAFEKHPEGTEKVVEAIAESDGFTVLGGGHTSSLVHRFGLELDDFSHVSIAGGAFVRYLSGEELPAVKALK